MIDAVIPMEQLAAAGSRAAAATLWPFCTPYSDLTAASISDNYRIHNWVSGV
jgi:hypothetical protein